MINTLLGIKKEMRSGYDARGRRVAVTVIEVKPNYVVGRRSAEKDGYEALQIGAGVKKSVAKPQKGQFAKAKAPETLRFVREINDDGGVELGQEVKVGEVFRKGDAVKVTGVSKGRGFQGGVKRYGFHGGPKTHGQSDRHRAPGSIGSGTTPGRVFRGKRMAGHMGMDQVSLKNVEVIEVDKAHDVLVIKGGVPGPIGGMVRLKNIGKIKGYVAPPEEKEDEEEESAAIVEKTEGVSSEENAAQAEAEAEVTPAAETGESSQDEAAAQPEEAGAANSEEGDQKDADN